MANTFEAVRAEALFASNLQSSQSPAADEIRRAIAAMLRQLGIRGCADRVAAHQCLGRARFGDTGVHNALAGARGGRRRHLRGNQ